MTGPYNINNKVNSSQLATAATADSVAQRTSNGSLNTVELSATGTIQTTSGGILYNPSSNNGAVVIRELGGSAANSGVEMHIRPSSGKSGYISFTEDSVADVASIGISAGTNALLFKTGSSIGTERMRIDSSGNVGIGTSSPRSTLDLGVAESKALSNNLADYQLVLEAPGGTGSFCNSICWGQTSSSSPAVASISAVDEGGTVATGIVFSTGNSASISERMRIDSSGNVGIGTSSPVGKLDVAGTAPSFTIRDTQQKSWSIGDVVGNIDFYAEDTSGAGARAVSKITTVADGGSSAASGAITFSTAGTTTSATERMRIDSSGNVLAGADNTQTLGGASKRWSVVYAGTGIINTSDAREKTPVDELTPDELNAAKQLSKEIGVYKFLSAVAEKGDNARKHIGMTVQRAIEIMEANNLDPFAYGFICYDEWEEKTFEHPAVEAKEAEYDEEGNVISEAVEAQEAYTEVTQEAGNRYSFRPDEMLFFIARGLEARIEALES